MTLTIFFFFLLFSFTSAISSSSSQTINTTPLSLDPTSTSTPTPKRPSTYMTGTPATLPSLAPGSNDGVSSVNIAIILAVVFGAIFGFSLLLVTAWVLWRASGRKRQKEVGKVECKVDGEDVLTEWESDEGKEVERKVDWKAM